MYERLKFLCLQKGISVSKLCEKLTGNSANLATWAKNNFKAEIIIKFAEYFNVSTDYLLFGTDKPSYEEKKKEAVSLIEELTPDEIKKLLEYKDFLISQRNKK